jgi:hypothetical protein
LVHAAADNDADDDAVDADDSAAAAAASCGYLVIYAVVCNGIVFMYYIDCIDI